MDEYGGKIVRNYRPVQSRGTRKITTMEHIFTTTQDFDEQFHKQGLFTRTYPELKCQFSRQGIDIGGPSGCGRSGGTTLSSHTTIGATQYGATYGVHKWVTTQEYTTRSYIDNFTYIRDEQGLGIQPSWIYYTLQ